MIKLDPLTQRSIEAKGYADGYSAMMRLWTPPKTNTSLPTNVTGKIDDADLHRLILERSISFEDAEHTLNFIRENPEFRACKTPQERRKFLDKKKNEIHSRRNELIRDKERLAYLHHNLDGFHEMLDWAQQPLVLQKPDGTLFRSLRREVKDGAALYFAKTIDDVLPAEDYDKEVFCAAEILVVEHNWADAFANTSIVKDDHVRLPYDVCAFEFKISDRPVIALATQLESEIYFSPVVSTSKGWIIPNFAINANDIFRAAHPTVDEGYVDLIYLLGQQIKAICIALDAEVAKSDVVREAHAGPSGNNTYAALASYRVVSLARRYGRTLPSGSVSAGRKIRLHFRRGHWRHFPEFKTWIKWCLVGDPELGFIEKHYKL